MSTIQQQSGQKRSLLSSSIKFGTVSLMIYTFAIISSILVIYLMNFNNASTKGYELKRLEVNRLKLVMQTEQQKLQISEAKSIENIKNRSVLRYMVKTDMPIFMRLDTAVARAD